MSLLYADDGRPIIPNGRSQQKPGFLTKARNLVMETVDRFRHPKVPTAEIERQIEELLGFVVPSAFTDLQNQWRRFSQTNDAQELFRIYSKIRQGFANESLVDAANRQLTRKAVSQGCSIAFEAKIPRDDVKRDAKIAESLCAPVIDMINGGETLDWQFLDFDEQEDQPISIGDVSEMLGRYSNIPSQLQYETDGIGYKQIARITPMAPFAWVKNNDSRFQWKSYKDPETGKMVYEPHYIKFDVSTFAIDGSSMVGGQGIEDPNNKLNRQAAFFSDRLVFAMTNREPWERYGIPRSLKILTHLYGVIELFSNLADARKAGTPEKLYMTGVKKSLNFSELLRLKNSLPKAMIDRGERPSVWDFHKVLNGVEDAKVLSVSTDFFNQFGDLRSYDERIAIAYDIVLANLLRPNEVNRATKELLDRAESYSQRLWAAHLAKTYIFPIIRRQLRASKLSGKNLRAIVTWSEAFTPEELLAKYNVSKEAQQQSGNITFDSAQKVVCDFVGLDQANEQAKGATAENQQKMRTQQQSQQQQQQGQPSVTDKPSDHVDQELLKLGDSDISTKQQFNNKFPAAGHRPIVPGINSGNSGNGNGNQEHKPEALKQPLNG